MHQLTPPLRVRRHADRRPLFDLRLQAIAESTTTGNINLANPGTASFDGVSLSVNDILFVRAQTAPAENGLYTFNGSGVALTRIIQMDAWSEIPGALFTVEEGSTYADTIWFCNANQGGTLGTTAITFTQVNATGLSSSNFVDKEIPSGAINGSNTSYSLANTPVSGSEHVYLNGFSRSPVPERLHDLRASITMATAPLSGEKLRVSYRK